MKRLEASQSRQFSPLVLRLDGLREILTVLAPAEEVKIIADRIEYESVDELAGHLLGKSPRELGVSEFLCKRFGLQLTEMRSPN